MSGQQIGTAVGFVAGFFLPGGPQVWAAIGGFIGGVIDPTEIKGPHIGDGAQQSSNEGNPIAWILGTAGWIQGNLVQVSARREVKKEDDGKGGPVVVTYEAHQDYCIMPAESSETRQSTIVGVLMVRVNGKIVYDMRPGSNLGAENAKFLQRHTFHYGAEDQMPDPTMEAISGVGNTPAYRGVFTMVARDINITEYGDAIPTYEFVLVGNGEVITESVDNLAPISYARFVDGGYPVVDAESKYLIENAYHQNIGEIPGPFDTIADALAALSGEQVFGNGVIYLGYSASGGSNSFSVMQPSVVNNVTVKLTYNEQKADRYFAGIFSDDAAVAAAYNAQPGAGVVYGDENGAVFTLAQTPRPPPPAGMGVWTYANFNGTGQDWEAQILFPFTVEVSRIGIEPEYVYGDPCVLGQPVLLPDAPGFIIDCDGTVSKAAEFSPAPAGTYWALQNETRETVPGGLGYQRITRYVVTPILADDDPDNNQTFWEAEALEKGVPGDYGVDYPVNLGSTNVFVSSVTSEYIATNALSVATAISRIAVRGGLTIPDLDVADIDAILQGYPIQADYNAADDIKPLLAYCSAFASEYDGQIHFHPYGEAIEIVIDPEDFVEGSDITDDGSREQAKEYPRKLSVNSIDITQNYTVRPQYAYRNTPDVRAIGEETIQIPLCDTPDHTAKIAEIAIKVSYARMQGTRKFTVPYVGADTYLKLVPGMPFALDGKRWVANRIMLEDGVMAIEAAYDRQSAYTSDATGVPALPPTPPDSTVGGVTLFAVMNLPVLRDQDDKLVLYFAVTGLLPGWQGCLLQWSVDGGASWQTAISSMTESSVIGFLTAPLALAPAEGDDITNTLSVSVRGGELNSITYLQYLNEGNPCAILKPSLQAEVLQFLDSDETEPNEYDLTTLARGRLGTTPAAHLQGARFCGLDSVYVMEIPSAYRGRELLFRPVTFGTAPENNAVYSLLFDPPVSQTELAPQDISYEIVGTEMFLHVYPRHRLGTSAQPVASSNMVGYSWHVTDGVNIANRETTSQDTVISISGWASPITVQVSQVNRFTGAGPALEVII